MQTNKQMKLTRLYPEDISFIDDYLYNILNGNPEYVLNDNLTSQFRSICEYLLSTGGVLSPPEISVGYNCLQIANAIYENSDLDDSEQIIDNSEIYDKLVVLIGNYTDIPVGAPPVNFGCSLHEEMMKKHEPVEQVTAIQAFKYCSAAEDAVFNTVFPGPLKFGNAEYLQNAFRLMPDDNEGRQYRDTKHGSPELVGTLTKQKFVLISQAIDAGVIDDPNVTVLERDFFQKHINLGILNPNSFFHMVLELKADGVSVEGTIKRSMLIRGCSRGDTENDIATDVTPILYGYQFPYLPKDIEVDCKFEAVMTYVNFERFKHDRGVKYANCRSAIISIFGSKDGYKYKDYITLLPIKIAKSSMSENPEELPSMSRSEELHLLELYFRSPEYIRYIKVSGDLTTVLYQINKFVDEAEAFRGMMPYMYDGVVVSYEDDYFINNLGRSNSINMYSTAIKFRPGKAYTKFLGYSYTVGQDGTITPMFHYEPVSFMGAVQQKSSCSSYDRFMRLGLRVGDTIQIEYVNDVMAYVTKPDISENLENPNPLIPFPTVCPCCGTSLVFSTKSAKCPNLSCNERNIKRLSNLFDKLNLKDIAESTFASIISWSKTVYISDYIRCYIADGLNELVNIIGLASSSTFCNHLMTLQTQPMYDYDILGALGFTSIGKQKWKLILKEYDLKYILDHYQDDTFTLSNIKGIGEETTKTIVSEIPFYLPDLEWIVERYKYNIQSSKNLVSNTAKVRFSGCRGGDLPAYLESLGIDANPNGSVTQDTSLLIIPSSDYTSTKVSKANKYNIPIVTLKDFTDNMDDIIRKILQTN